MEIGNPPLYLQVCCMFRKQNAVKRLTCVFFFVC